MNLKRLFIAVVFVLVVGGSLFASLGTLTVTVVDGSGNPIEGAQVTLQSATGKFIYSASGRTGNDGTITFQNVPYGVYTITVNALGYDPVTVGPVTIDSAERRRLIAVD